MRIITSVSQLILTIIQYNSYVDGKLSKCAQNHLNAKEETRKAVLEEWENSQMVDINEFLSEVRGPRSPLTYPANIPELYPSCRRVNIQEHSPDPSLLVDFNNGRLGNQISSLASTVCLAEEHGLRPMVTHKTSQHLSQYFTNISSKVDILESKFCSPWSDLEFVSIEKMTGSSGQTLVTPTYPNLVELFPKYIFKLNSIFTLKEELIDEAKEFLEKLKTESGIKQPTIVTIHARRTDYTQSYIQMIGRDIVTEEYFRRAIKYVKENMTDPILIFVSDDMEWCRRNIHGHNIFYSPNRDTARGVGVDLALLALSEAERNILRCLNLNLNCQISRFLC